MNDCEVVIESVFDIGTESELDIGKQSHDGACHEMRGRVPKGVEGYSIIFHSVDYSVLRENMKAGSAVIRRIYGIATVPCFQ